MVHEEGPPFLDVLDKCAVDLQAASGPNPAERQDGAATRGPHAAGARPNTANAAKHGRHAETARHVEHEHEHAAELVTIGDEILAGDIVNTNAAFLARRVRQLGLVVRRTHVVRDRLDEIAQVIGAVAERAAVVLVSGGLGPTTDDLTTAGIALAAGVPLERDRAAEARLEQKFQAFGRAMPAANRKQADFPRGADVLANPIGTAEGFAVEIGACRVFSLPGVPWELERMMIEEVEPRLRAALRLVPVPRRVYRLLGRGESAVAESLEPLLAEARSRSPGLAAMYVHYRASMPEVQVIYEATPDAHGRRATEDELRSLDGPVAEACGEALYGIGTASLAPRVIAALTQAGLRICTAESCTGGGVGRAIAAIAGASTCFDGGVVAYEDRVKQAVLGVPASMLAEHGAVSEPVARAMAEGALRAIGSDLSVAVTGIAGPSGGTPEKPVGTVHISVFDGNAHLHKSLRLRGDRGTVQRASERWALKLVWDVLVRRDLAHVTEME